MAASIMKYLPHDIIRQIILLSTQEERLRKDTLDYWTRLWAEGGKPVRVQYKALKEVHNQMKFVTRLERDACHRSALPLPGSTQADEGSGVMWRRVWWSSRWSWDEVWWSSRWSWDEWDSFLQDRRQKEEVISPQPWRVHPGTTRLTQ